MTNFITRQFSWFRNHRWSSYCTKYLYVYMYFFIFNNIKFRYYIKSDYYIILPFINNKKSIIWNFMILIKFAIFVNILHVEFKGNCKLSWTREYQVILRSKCSLYIYNTSDNTTDGILVIVVIIHTVRNTA